MRVCNTIGFIENLPTVGRRPLRFQACVWIYICVYTYTYIPVYIIGNICPQIECEQYMNVNKN